MFDICTQEDLAKAITSTEEDFFIRPQFWESLSASYLPAHGLPAICALNKENKDGYRFLRFAPNTTITHSPNESIILDMSLFHISTVDSVIDLLVQLCKRPEKTDISLCHPKLQDDLQVLIMAHCCYFLFKRLIGSIVVDFPVLYGLRRTDYGSETIWTCQDYQLDNTIAPFKEMCRTMIGPHSTPLTKQEQEEAEVLGKRLNPLFLDCVFQNWLPGEIQQVNCVGFMWEEYLFERAERFWKLCLDAHRAIPKISKEDANADIEEKAALKKFSDDRLTAEQFFDKVSSIIAETSPKRNVLKEAFLNLVDVNRGRLIEYLQYLAIPQKRSSKSALPDSIIVQYAEDNWIMQFFYQQSNAALRSYPKTIRRYDEDEPEPYPDQNASPRTTTLLKFVRCIKDIQKRGFYQYNEKSLKTKMGEQLRKAGKRPAATPSSGHRYYLSDLVDAFNNYFIPQEDEEKKTQQLKPERRYIEMGEIERWLDDNEASNQLDIGQILRKGFEL